MRVHTFIPSSQNPGQDSIFSWDPSVRLCLFHYSLNRPFQNHALDHLGFAETSRALRSFSLEHLMRYTDTVPGEPVTF